MYTYKWWWGRVQTASATCQTYNRQNTRLRGGIRDGASTEKNKRSNEGHCSGIEEEVAEGGIGNKKKPAGQMKGTGEENHQGTLRRPEQQEVMSWTNYTMGVTQELSLEVRLPSVYYPFSFFLRSPLNDRFQLIPDKDDERDREGQRTQKKHGIIGDD
ncbi:hypothetical protein BaRGS_00016667 [Batillaria attramentaria]|uniref:Uncharacterized protein n=1 Tax=Batillaria attramentaria TaxID=370345 RepID=A0ABD0KYI0_9CAEN